MKSFGERLAYLRNKKKLSQEELAAQLRIAKSTLGMYETNKREPKHEMTATIANYFDVSVDWMTTGKDPVTNDIKDRSEYIIKELVEKYNIDLGQPGATEKLEQIIKLVFDSSRSDN